MLGAEARSGAKREARLPPISMAGKLCLRLATQQLKEELGLCDHEVSILASRTPLIVEVSSFVNFQTKRVTPTQKSTYTNLLKDNRAINQHDASESE
jgi:hypothetical protein